MHSAKKSAGSVALLQSSQAGAKLVAILASGAGTTAETFIRAGAEGRIDAGVDLVICNNAKAGIFDRIAGLNKEHGLTIKTALINSITHPVAAGEKLEQGAQTQAEEAAILETLLKGSYDLIVLMGYMKRVGPRLVQEFGWRSKYTVPYQAMMLNTHPGLLPETAGLYGKHIQEYVLDNGRPYSGQTLHVVAEDYDDGPIIAQHKVSVRSNDTPDTLFARVQAIEKKTLPQDIDAFIKNRQNYLSKKGA